jgi:hypothetical protein
MAVHIIEVLLVTVFRLRVETLLLLLLLVAKMRRPHILAPHLIFEILFSLSVFVEIEITLIVHWP